MRATIGPPRAQVAASMLCGAVLGLGLAAVVGDVRKTMQGGRPEPTSATQDQINWCNEQGGKATVSFGGRLTVTCSLP